MTRPPWITPPVEESLPLFASAKAPAVRHSPTSVAAAESITPEAMTDGQRKVYQFIAAQGGHGATDEECQLRIPMDANTQRPRRRELEDKGVIFSDGTRKTRSNKSAAVWKLTIYRRPA